MSVRKLALYVAIIVALLPVVIMGRCEYQSRSFANGFNAIKVGDSRETVFELMGGREPGGVEQCRPGESCKYSYIYYTFMQRWMVDFDENDRVAFKIYHEGSY